MTDTTVPPTHTAYSLSQGKLTIGTGWGATPLPPPATGATSSGQPEPLSPAELNSVRPSIAACRRIGLPTASSSSPNSVP